MAGVSPPFSLCLWLGQRLYMQQKNGLQFPGHPLKMLLRVQRRLQRVDRE